MQTLANFQIVLNNGYLYIDKQYKKLSGIRIYILYIYAENICVTCVRLGQGQI